MQTMLVNQEKVGEANSLFSVLGYSSKVRSNVLVVTLAGFGQAMSEKNYLHSTLRKHLVLNHNHTVLQFDYRGHGDSEGELGDVCLDTMVADAFSVIHTFLARATYRLVVLIGHALGGLIASQVAPKLEEAFSLPIQIVMVSPVVQKLPQSHEVFAQEVLSLLEKEQKVDSQILCPGYDYQTFADFDMRQVEYFTRLGAYMLYLHGQCISFRFLKQLDRLDPAQLIRSCKYPLTFFIGANEAQDLCSISSLDHVHTVLIPNVTYFYEHPLAMDFIIDSLGNLIDRWTLQVAEDKNKLKDKQKIIAEDN